MPRQTKVDRQREAIYKRLDVKFPRPYGSETFKPNAMKTMADEILRLTTENATLRDLVERLGCCCGRCVAQITGGTLNA